MLLVLVSNFQSSILLQYCNIIILILLHVNATGATDIGATCFFCESRYFPKHINGRRHKLRNKKIPDHLTHYWSASYVWDVWPKF